jgi:hypothetical protein
MFMAAVTMLVGCSEDEEKSTLSQVQLSQSLISLPAGEDADPAEQVYKTDITINAKGDWKFTDVPEWLTITPAEGSAGEYTVTFQASKTTESRSAFLKLLCNGQEQEVNVQQIAKKVDVPLSTCAQVIAGDDGKTYRVKGTVKSIANTTYGNWYLVDETGEVYIYGTLDKNGAEKNFLSLGIGVGDIVTVEGPKTTYNGTIELVNVTVIAIEKSLIAVDALDIENNTIAKTGGEFHATLSNKGEGLNVNISEDAKDWLFVTGITISGETTTVTFRALPNDGAARKATITFVTTSGDKEYTAETAVAQEGAVVTCSVADFLAAEVGDAQYRLTGVISELYYYKEAVAGFYISDYSGTVLVYKPTGFTGTEAKLGDVITVAGKRGAYKETPQMTSCALESVDYAVVQVSLDEFLTKEDSNDVYYMVTGTVDEIANATYGNLYLKSGETRLYVYGCYPGWGATGDARKNCLEDKNIEVGDQLTVIGIKSTYNEVGQLKNGIYFSHAKAE